MKKVIFILAVFFIMTLESRAQKQAGNDDLIKIDVTKTNYPKEELILQDFTDVEYIPLETTDDFVNEGLVQDIGNKFIIVTNGKTRNGDIFIYSRTGRALRKINRKGLSGEEYTGFLRIILDEDKNEIYVNDILKGKILVYNLSGKFKRSFPYKGDGDGRYYTDMFNYDKDHLICYDEYNKTGSFFLIFKQDGSIYKEIKIPFKKKLLLRQIIYEPGIKDATTKSYSVSSHIVTPGNQSRITSYNGNRMLSEISSDTIYGFMPDYGLRPFLVRTPPIQSMNPEVFLILNCFYDRYIFMEAIKNVYDWNAKEGFPSTFIMYDKQKKSFSRYIVYSGDYSTKKEIYLNSLKTDNYQIGSWRSLEAYQLVDDYKKGILKGKLKEIASKLKEDDNPVIMLIKQKK